MGCGAIVGGPRTEGIAKKFGLVRVARSYGTMLGTAQAAEYLEQLQMPPGTKMQSPEADRLRRVRSGSARLGRLNLWQGLVLLLCVLVIRQSRVTGSYLFCIRALAF